MPFFREKYLPFTPSDGVDRSILLLGMVISFLQPCMFVHYFSTLIMACKGLYLFTIYYLCAMFLEQMFHMREKCTPQRLQEWAGGSRRPNMTDYF